MRIIISGGGTGGHIFPAIAIADAIMKINPATEILFVGAMGKMEMEKVPASGYKIQGLDIVGIKRKLSFKNLLVPFKVVKSMIHARNVIREFKPDLAVGVGGYASGPLLKMCSWMNIPYVLQEQNSYAGITNKLLGKKAEKIFVAYKGMDRFFDIDKILLTGNPIRSQIVSQDLTTAEARAKFKVDTNKKTTLVFGGSLGARTLNNAIALNTASIELNKDIQIIWQVGKLYYDEFANSEVAKMTNVKVLPFIEDMAAAYKAADVIVCRSGALTISELCLLGKPAILVPSPNVAEDHQTHNAMALVNEHAAIMVKDVVAGNELISTMLSLIHNDVELKKLSKNIRKLATPDAAEIIAQQIVKIAGIKGKKWN